MGSCNTSTNCNPCGPDFNAINQLATRAGAYARQANTYAVDAENSWLEFNALYLGAFAVAPTVDNEGNPLQVGALYWNTATNNLWAWNGVGWTVTNNFNEFTPFLATGTTTPRNLVTREADVVNVKDFGAVGDGVADDTAAIQAAFAAATSQANNKIVFFPSGDFRITAPLSIPQDGFTIIGSGFGFALLSTTKHGSRIIADFTGGYVLTSNKNTTSVSDIIIDSSANRLAAARDMQGGGIMFDTARTSRLSRVQVWQQPGNGIYLCRSISSALVENCSVGKVKGHAYVVDDGTLGGLTPISPAGIITLNTCKAERADGCGLLVGDPAKTSGTLSAYRVLALNFEPFYCGGVSSIGGDAVIKLFSDNNTISGSAVRGPENQIGGISNTLGDLWNGSQADVLVNGVIVDGRNNHLINTRFIDVRQPAVKVKETSTNTVVSGAEFRHSGTSADNFTTPIDVEAGVKSISINNLGTSQVVAGGNHNVSLSKRASADCIMTHSTNSWGATVAGVPSGQSVILDGDDENLSYYDGTAQKVRIGSEGDVRVANSIRGFNNNVQSCGVPAARWTEVFAVNGVINTSDATYKQQIQEVSESVLRAWGNVKVKQYKFNHAVDAKGEKARWHHGVIAQEVKEAFENEGLDAFEYGVLCYDSWEDELDDNGNIINPSGSSYGIRYEEALAIECAYQRWRAEGGV
jgi:hypothetical protein